MSLGGPLNEYNVIVISVCGALFAVGLAIIVIILLVIRRKRQRQKPGLNNDEDDHGEEQLEHVYDNAPSQRGHGPLEPTGHGQVGLNQDSKEEIKCNPQNRDNRVDNGLLSTPAVNERANAASLNSTLYDMPVFSDDTGKRTAKGKSHVHTGIGNVDESQISSTSKKQDIAIYGNVVDPSTLTEDSNTRIYMAEERGFQATHSPQDGEAVINQGDLYESIWQTDRATVSANGKDENVADHQVVQSNEQPPSKNIYIEPTIASPSSGLEPIGRLDSQKYVTMKRNDLEEFPGDDGRYVDDATPSTVHDLCEALSDEEDRTYVNVDPKLRSASIGRNPTGEKKVIDKSFADVIRELNVKIAT